MAGAVMSSRKDEVSLAQHVVLGFVCNPKKPSLGGATEMGALRSLLRGYVLFGADSLRAFAPG